MGEETDTQNQATQETTPAPEYLQSWMQQLPREMWKNEDLAQYSKIGGLAGEYLKLRAVPAPDVPESSDGYQVKYAPPEGREENKEYAERLRTDFIKAAHGVKLTREQADAVFKWHNETTNRTITDYEANRQKLFEEAEQKLKAEWGENAEGNLEVVGRGIRMFADDEAKSVLKDADLDNHPAIVKMFHRIGQAISEDAVPKGGGATKTTPRAGVFDYPNSPELD